MFQFWGDGSQLSKDLVNQIAVRSTDNFNWTFIFILAVVFYVYWSEINKKNYEAVFAGLALYGVHWFYEICNAIIGHIFGYPLWSVSNESTTFILLIGVCWELSMMFSLAGIISFKMLPHDRSTRFFSKNGKGGINCKLAGALEMALLFALFESFLAGTSNHSFIWVLELSSQVQHQLEHDFKGRTKAEALSGTKVKLTFNKADLLIADVCQIKAFGEILTD